ncbi:MAG TPA: helix-turn-helix transcriptional regulator [Lacunisphaera sp.]
MSPTDELREPALLRRARKARRMTIPEAADDAGISQQNWARIEQGQAKTIPDGTLAHMAHAVQIAPEQLEGIGRHEAAEILREIERQASQPEGRQSGEMSTEELIVKAQELMDEAAEYLRRARGEAG